MAHAAAPVYKHASPTPCSVRPRYRPPKPHGSRYESPAKVQLESPVRKARLRPFRSASSPTNGRQLRATTEKVPMMKPTARSDPPSSFRTCGANAGSTVPNPRKPRKVAAIRHQKRPLSRSEDPIAHDRMPKAP